MNIEKGGRYLGLSTYPTPTVGFYVVTYLQYPMYVCTLVAEIMLYKLNKYIEYLIPILH